MKVLDPALLNSLSLESTCIAWCWLLKRKDGINLGFTSLDIMLPIDGVPYYPFTGFSPSADAISEGLSSNNSSDLAGIITDEQISFNDLISGKLDEAELVCFQVDVTNLPDSLSQDPPRHLLQYHRVIKSVEISELGFKFQLRDDDYELEATIGKVTSKFCDYDLGGDFCGVDLTPYTFTESITSTDTRHRFFGSGSYDVGQFDRGNITFTTGANAGISRDVAFFREGNEIVLWSSLPFSIAVGDEYTIVQGCNKTLFDCITRYNNAYRCDCMPNIPTIDQAINTPIE